MKKEHKNIQTFEQYTDKNMKINWKKEVYSVSILKGDTHFQQYSMDNRSYSRINGKWHVNTGGSELEWRRVNKKEQELLEDVFKNTVDKNMKINWKKEVYSVSILKGDTHFQQYSMDNRSYSRINGKWHVNTGGSELEWRRVNKKEQELLEDVFKNTVEK